jgi:uncharacterized membrane protein YeiB
MSRIVFAIAVPAIAGAIGTLAFANIVASGFQSEGCRVASSGLRWREGGEWLMVQALFGVPSVLLLGALVSSIRKREMLQGRTSPLARWCAGVGLVAISAYVLQGLFFIMTCGSTVGIGAAGPFLQPALRLLTSISVLAFLVCVAVAYVNGLRADRAIADGGQGT